MQKLLSLIRSCLFIFGFISIILGDKSEKNIAAIYVSVLPKFSVGILQCSVTFRSLIHFELIFVYAVTEQSNFILFFTCFSVSQVHLLKRLSFYHCVVMPPLSQIN